MRRVPALAWGTMRAVTLLFLGLLALVATPASAQEQAGFGGRVVQIGYGGAYEPTSWIPMKVRLTAPGGEAGAYRLRVHQRDLDGDRVTYERAVSLSGGDAGGGGGVGQDFWTYFKLDPSTADFDPTRDVRVVLADGEGRELAQLALPPGNLRSLEGGAMGNTLDRPRRLVLLVGGEGGGFYPGAGELSVERVAGLTEVTEPAAVTVADLPDRAIGYDGVFAVVWQGADPADLLAGGGERMRALRQWVESGGRLVVTHRSDWQALQPIFELLPVTPVAAFGREDLLPLRDLGVDQAGTAGVGGTSAYEAAPGPFRYVVGVPKEEATVLRWMYPDDIPAATRAELGDVLQDGRAPLAARGPFGFGSVTWLALDLGNRNVAGMPNDPTLGWSSIWARLLDTGDQPVLEPTEGEAALFDADGYRDLGRGPLGGARLPGKSVALVTLALVFFIAYWLLAGPGLYSWLAMKKRAHLSWFAFGAAAAIAALLTVGVTRLVLRGPEELAHLSVLRAGREAPRRVVADLGLYIPRDGAQRLTLDDGAAGTRPVLTAFVPPPDPIAAMGGTRTNPISYTVRLDPPTEDEAAGLEGEAAVVDIPYRSTLKKLEATWAGLAVPGIEGRPKFERGARFPTGQMLNTSGYDLRNVYLCYRDRDRDAVMVLWLPAWRNGQTLPGLERVYGREAEARPKLVSRRASAGAGPPRDAPVYGTLANDWAANFWFLDGGLRRTSTGMTREFDDFGQPVRATPVMLSLYPLLPPMRNATPQSPDATVLQRRGVRDWDASAAVSAGHLVVIADAANVPAPLPLEVEGGEVGGDGQVVAQFVVPLDRSVLATIERERYLETLEEDAPTTREAESP